MKRANKKQEAMHQNLARRFADVRVRSFESLGGAIEEWGTTWEDEYHDAMEMSDEELEAVLDAAELVNLYPD